MNPGHAAAPTPNGDRATARQVLTVGHSTRPIEDFIALLAAHGVTQLVDVRTVPRSRHNPQYGTEALAASLESSGIGYVHAPGLGGFPPTRPDSLNTAWRNLSFRGYADYMQSPDFAENLHALVELASTDRVAIMCAEAVPWRCHRSLIADALLVHGIPSAEIVSTKRLQPHRLTPFAKVRGEALSYPSEDA
jgi:uncharacterized protein (DUF488 family)